MGFSYLAIRGGVDAVIGKFSAGSDASGGHAAARRRAAWVAVTFIGRYLVIGVAAWVLLVPVRAHPLGVIAGVSAPVFALGVEAVRLVRAGSRRGR
jgi:hypothetical protein